MRRFVFFLLAAFFALQSGVIAAASYCNHEKADHNASHLGHHDHEHAGDKAPLTPDTVDPDCSVCHLSGAGFLDMTCVRDVSTAARGELPAAAASAPSITIAGLFRPPIPRRS